MLHMSTVDKPGSRAMLHQFNLHHVLPTHNHLTKVAVPMFINKVKIKIKEQIKESDYFAATTDLWTLTASDPYKQIKNNVYHSSCRQWLRVEVILPADLLSLQGPQTVLKSLKKPCSNGSWRIRSYH